VDGVTTAAGTVTTGIVIADRTTTSTNYVGRSAWGADGYLSATAQQFPGRMGEAGVEAAATWLRKGQRPDPRLDTGVSLVAARSLNGVPSIDLQAGLAACWGGDSDLSKGIRAYAYPVTRQAVAQVQAAVAAIAARGEEALAELQRPAGAGADTTPASPGGANLNGVDNGRLFVLDGRGEPLLFPSGTGPAGAASLAPSLAGLTGLTTLDLRCGPRPLPRARGTRRFGKGGRSGAGSKRRARRRAAASGRQTPRREQPSHWGLSTAGGAAGCARVRRSASRALTVRARRAASNSTVVRRAEATWKIRPDWIRRPNISSRQRAWAQSWAWSLDQRRAGPFLYSTGRASTTGGRSWI
jgi:hypothetical protein